MRALAVALVLLALAMLGACRVRGDVARPIPQVLHPAPQAAERLVVVLPGRGDDIAGLERAGIVQAVQSAWPDADVVLTGLAMDYYLQGRAPQRLHDEVVAPARARGRYRQAWLVGASLGGMGSVLYERAFPGEMDGIVLLAPYMGDARVLDGIAAGGGIARWDAGPRPAQVDAGNFQRELWRQVQDWSRDPRAARRVWLAWGDRDSLAPAARLIAPALPPGHALERNGAHAWTLWTPALAEILRAADGARRDPAGG